jgi:hypothetical protein
MSAVSYQLSQGSYGPVRIRKTGGYRVCVFLHGNKIVDFNLVTGRVKLDICDHPTMQTSNAISRFFSIIGFSRYNTFKRKNNLVLIDKVKGTTTPFPACGWQYVTVPTKCVLQTINRSFGNYHSISNMVESFENDKERAMGASTEEIPF